MIAKNGKEAAMRIYSHEYRQQHTFGKGMAVAASSGSLSFLVADEDDRDLGPSFSTSADAIYYLSGRRSSQAYIYADALCMVM